MRNNGDVAGPAGLRFFGRMTALATHELNNCLGIIGENAGLLGDLVQMADRGMEVDPRRWVTVCERIDSQVRRAGEIVGRLNRFAHSVDSDRTEVDIRSLLELAVALAARLLAEDRAGAELTGEPERLVLTTAPFPLIHLVGRCLAFAGRHAAAPDRKIRISCVPDGRGGVVVTFRGLDQVEEPSFPGRVEQELLALLGAGLRLSGSGGLVLELGGGTA